MLERLEEAFDSQKRFLDDAGHELRAPLTVARGHLELLGDDPAEREADVALVLDELDRMDRLVRDLRTPGPLRSPRLRRAGDRRHVGARSTELGPQGGRPGRPRLPVVVDHHPGAVAADRHRLTEAVLNLAENAAEATPTGRADRAGAAEPDDGR